MSDKSKIKNYGVVLSTQGGRTGVNVYELVSMGSWVSEPTPIGGIRTFGDIFKLAKLEKVQPIIHELLTEAYEIIRGAKGPSGFGAAAVPVFCVQVLPEGAVQTKGLPEDVSTAIHTSGYNVGYRFHVVGTGVSPPTVYDSEAAAKGDMATMARKKLRNA